MDILHQFRTALDRLPKYPESFFPTVAAILRNRSRIAQTPLELEQLARGDSARGGPGEYPFKVTYVAYPAGDLLEAVRMGDEMGHDVIAGRQLLQVHRRHREPVAQHTGAHWRGTSVHHIHQGTAFRSGIAVENLEVAESETVHPHETPLIYPGYGAYVAQATVMGLFQVHQQGSCGTYAQRAAVHGIALQGIHLKLPAELFRAAVIDKGPFLEVGDIGRIPEGFPRHLLTAALHDHLAGIEGGEQGGYEFLTALGKTKGAGGNVQEGRSHAVLAEAYSRKIVVLLALEHLVAERDSRSH